ncbi:peptidoglycan recognition protein family protein [Mycobacterium asiaticum]|uniref:peptidoglycan recognition protein family protein n=1 Tax=Mycobacterium asiaticum TaxID=1790 RepID=UPI000AE6A00B|nr:peptidoglycan recognition family protein [Mycobacterium asiaticum]
MSRPAEHRDAVSRRRLLQLVGGGALSGVVAGCATARPSLGPSTTSAAGPAPTAPTSAAPAPPPAPAPAPAPAATSAALLCRDAWGARPARPGGTPHTITRLTLHHSGVVLGDNRNAPARLRQHQRYHQDQHGWIDIAYHVSVDRNGNIYELRATELVGDTATDYDPTGHFLVLCEGDFDTEAISEAQLRGTAIVFAWAAQRFGVSTDTLASHRDFAPTTSCPGANLYAQLTSGSLKRRIDSLLAAGPVDLQRNCGAPATEVVAGIEAGR